jgi:hypothetical protein
MSLETVSVRVAYGTSSADYNLWRDPETDLLQWSEGFVEELIPQRHSGAMSYRALPTGLSDPIAFEDWSGGAGLVQEAPGAVTSKRYSYTQHVDASWGDRLYKSPALNAETGQTDSIIGQVYTTFGLYGWSNQRVYKHSGLTWDLVYNAGSAIVTQVVEFSNTVDTYLVVAQGDATDAVYSTTGAASSFTNTFTDAKAKFMAVLGHTTVEPNLLLITSTGAVSSVNAITDTPTATDQIGGTQDTVNGVEVMNGLAIFIKSGGVYTFDGLDVEEKLLAGPLFRTTNGAARMQWSGDGLLYFNWDTRILRYDPVNDAFSTVYAPEHPILNGDIPAITGTTTHIYFTQVNADGDTYVMKGNPNVGAWHTWAYIGSSAATSLLIARQGTIHASRDVVSITHGTSSAGSYILPLDGLRPEDDGAYRFEQTQGFIEGPLVDGGARAFTSRLVGGRVLGESITGARAVSFQYGLDSGALTTLMTAVQSGLSEVRNTSDLPFTQVRYRAIMDTGSAQSSPRVLSLVFDTTPFPPRKRRFTFVVELEWAPRSGRSHRATAFTKARAFLSSSVDQLVTLTDPWDGTFVGKVDVQSIGFKHKGKPTSNKRVSALYQVTFEEITETTASGTGMTWDVSDWNGGDLWN